MLWLFIPLSDGGLYLIQADVYSMLLSLFSDQGRLSGHAEGDEEFEQALELD